MRSTIDLLFDRVGSGLVIGGVGYEYGGDP